MNATATPQAAAPVKNQRKLVGRVVSNKMQKTVVVQVERRVKHAVFGKIITRSSKYHAHVATGAFQEGDLVEIEETRPHLGRPCAQIRPSRARLRALSGGSARRR